MKHHIFRVLICIVGLLLMAVLVFWNIPACTEGPPDPLTPTTTSDAAPSGQLRFGPVVEAHLDIHPGSCPNPFNPKSNGVFPVAILGGEGFDVSAIDLSSVTLERVEPVPGQAKYGDTPGSRSADCECTHGKPDGKPDVTLKFRTEEVAAAIQPAWRDEVKELTLTGLLNDGTPFKASDCVRIVGVKETGPPEHVPTMNFATTITRIWPGGQTTVTKPYDPSAVPDTVGMLRPFSISYHGTSLNGPIDAYRFVSLTDIFDLPGEGVWTTDLSDTVRAFANNGDQVVPSGVYRLGAQCRDVLGAESVIDAGTFEEGVCQVVVNFDPDTKMFNVFNTYTVDGILHQELVDFSDDHPDTIPYNSWITLHYGGWDSPFDSTLCNDFVNKCIRYQMSYTRDSDRVPGVYARSRWLPDVPADTDPFGTTDSTSMNVGTVEYEVFVRSVDENDRPDGTPEAVPLVANFDPTLDDFSLENHTGDEVALDDTLCWNWWAPADSGYDFTSDPPRRTKTFYFVIGATGHDHPKDPDGSGVKTWYYEFYRDDDPTFEQDFARSGRWVEGLSVNVLSDTCRVTFSYPFDDLNGDDVFNNLPDWINRGYDFSIKGRDTALGEHFYQFVFVNGVRTLMNSYPVTNIGRWTREEEMRFYFKIQR